MDRYKTSFAGYRKVEVFDDHLDVNFPVFVMYPTDIPEMREHIGPYEINVAKNGQLQHGVFPLVLISHGGGGTPLVYRTIAHHLARNGFIVAMPEHPSNNIHNNDLENTIELLEDRPKNITQVIDWISNDSFFAPYVDSIDVGIIGHSMGGYTAIACVGGIPTTLPWETEDQLPIVVDVNVERRIKKAILLAPALGWFRNKGALDSVNVPILLMTGEKDEITPSFHAEFLLKCVKDPENKIEHKVIYNAGHFSFVSPFPQNMKKASFPPSQDPKGFNRELFHQQLNSYILNFFRS